MFQNEIVYLPFNVRQMDALNQAIGEDTKGKLMDKIATTICQPFQ
jgi:hypothetical protein